MEVAKKRPPLIAYSAVAAIIIQWLTLISFVLLDFQYAEKLRPISYWATRPNTHAIFTLGFTISGILIWIFAVIWARRFIKISIPLFSLSMLCFIAMATIPFRPEDIQNLVQHENITALFALTFVLGIFDVAWRNGDPELRKVSLICGIIGFIFGFITWRTDSSKYNTIIFYEIICTFVAQFWALWLSRYLIRQSKQS